MNNVSVRSKNFRKFKHAAMCGCIECRFNTIKYKPNGEKLNDYFNEEDFADGNGWF